MARRFVKSGLKVGTYHSTDGEVVVTPERIKRWAENHAKLSAANYLVPTDWDHADSIDKMQPVKMASGKGGKKRSAENTVGRLAEFSVAADGQSAELTVELTDPKAQGRAERNEVYISPVILDKWRDGAGSEYADVITHVDLVNHPVDHSQGPFREVAPEKTPGVVALALRMGTGKPAVIRLGDNPFAKKDGDGDGEAGEGTGDASKEAPPAAESENADMPQDKGDDQQLEAVLAHLRNDGYGLPSDTDSSNLVERLLTACLTKEATKAKADAEKAEAETEDSEEDADMTVADPGYAAMSLALNNMHRDRLKERLDSVLSSGRCDAAEHTRLATSLSAVRLSLDAEGKQLTKSELEQWIESREAVPEGTFWTPEQRTAKRMSLDVASPPAGTGKFDEFSDADADQTANWAMGGKATAAK